MSWREIIDTYSKWSDLRNIEKLKIVQSMYVWLIVVPLVSKLFSKIENTLVLTFAEKTYEIDLILPFSWKLFFFAAFLFSIGNVIYILFSPRIVKENKDYGEFTSSGKGYSHLESYVNNNPDDLVSFYLTKEYREVNRKTEKDIFWMMHENHDIRQVHARYCSLACYLFGGLLILYIISENIFWVVSQVFK